MPCCHMQRDPAGRGPDQIRWLDLLLCLQINIVMDYASGGSLFTYVQTRNRLREPLAR